MDGVYTVSKGSATASEVVIPAIYEQKPVIQIGISGFENYSNLTSVLIPDSIMVLGAYSFRNCTSLERVIFPVSLLLVGIMAFNDCTSLREIYILREYDYRKSWDQSSTCLEINNDGSATFNGCDPNIKFYVPANNGGVEYDGQYGSGSVAGVTAYKIYGIGWQIYADKILELPDDFCG